MYRRLGSLGKGEPSEMRGVLCQEMREVTWQFFDRKDVEATAHGKTTFGI